MIGCPTFWISNSAFIVCLTSSSVPKSLKHIKWITSFSYLKPLCNFLLPWKENPQPLLGPQGPAIQFGSWFPLRLYLSLLCLTLAPVPSYFTPIMEVGFSYFETSGTIADMVPSPWNTPLSSAVVTARQIFFILLPDFMSPAQEEACHIHIT